MSKITFDDPEMRIVAQQQSRGLAWERAFSSSVSEAVKQIKTYDFGFKDYGHDGHWCEEMRSNPIITAQYISLCHGPGLNNINKTLDSLPMPHAKAEARRFVEYRIRLSRGCVDNPPKLTYP